MAAQDTEFMNELEAAANLRPTFTSNMLLIAVFWSAMSDVWRPELAKRFYGYVAAGGSAGAIAGKMR